MLLRRNGPQAFGSFGPSPVFESASSADALAVQSKRRSSSNQTAALASLGARQSLRGESEPPEPTFGAFGIAERLNWLNAKKRTMNSSSQRLIAARSYSRRSGSAIVGLNGAFLASGRAGASKRPEAARRIQ